MYSEWTLSMHYKSSYFEC